MTNASTGTFFSCFLISYKLTWKGREEIYGKALYKWPLLFIIIIIIIVAIAIAFVIVIVIILQSCHQQPICLIFSKLPIQT